MDGFQIMRASSPICSPYMKICFVPKQENHSIKNGRMKKKKKVLQGEEKALQF